MQSDDGADQSQTIRRLRLKLQRRMTVCGILCELLDRFSRGELVDKKELLKQVPSEMRAELIEEMYIMESMVFFGEIYQKGKTRRISSGAAARKTQPAMHVRKKQGIGMVFIDMLLGEERLDE